MIDMRPWRWPRKPRRNLLVAGLAVLLYALAGFFLLPPLLKTQIERRAGALLQRPVTIQRLTLNPFALSGTVGDLYIEDRDKQPLLRWERLYVNFQLASIVRRTWIFREIELRNAAARLVTLEDGSLNVDDIIAGLTAAPPGAAPAPAGPPPAVRIGRLRIQGAELVYSDLTRPEPFRTILGPLRIDLRSFATHADRNNPYSFSGRTESGETFSWSGHFAIDPLRSTGQVELRDITLGKYHPYYRGTVPFDIRSGTADLRSAYTFEWPEKGLVLRAQDASVTLRDIRLSEHEAEEIAVEAPSVELTGGNVDLIGGEARIGSVVLTGGRVRLRRYPDGSINLLRMMLPFFVGGEETGSPSAPAPVATPAGTAPPAPPALVALDSIIFQDYAVDIEDQMPARGARVALDQVRLALNGVDNRPATTSRGTLEVRWNGEGHLRAEGDLSLVTLVGDLAVTATDLDLSPLDPYVEPVVDARLRSGALSADGRVQVSLVDMDRPRFSYDGSLRIDNFAMVDGRAGEPFVGFGSLQLQKVGFVLERETLRIGEVTLVDPVAHLTFESDGRSNLDTVLRTPVEVELESAETAPDQAENATAPAATAPPPQPAPTGGHISIGRARLRNGQIRYTDRAIAPPARFGLTRINGTLAGLSSRELARADVDIQARVDDDALLQIKGTINPLTENSFTDLSLQSRGIDLLPLGPYASKYLGYTLQKGRLDLDLKYLLDQRHLEGANIVTADQFTLGEKTDSPDATKLPVRLGLALLRDRNGVIKLDVPVQGSLDDPRFRLGRVILRAVVNVFGKLVASPFTLLARAFGGKETDLSSIDFDPGGTAITGEATEKIATLATALHERPALTLQIQGAVEPSTDREALIRLALDALVRKEKWESLSRRRRAEVTPEAVEVSADDYPGVLKDAFKRFRAALLDQGRLDPAAAAERPATAADQEAWMLARIEVTVDDLRQLAAGRARAVRDALVASGQVEAERLFIADGGEVVGRRVVLGMQ